MDHSEALRLQAAEKYVLGELSQQLRDEYEDHYFECQECAEELKATVAFVDSARGVLRTEVPAHTEAEVVRQRVGWLAWLRPTVAVPLFAALLLVVGYQNLVTIPRLQRATSVGGQNAAFVSLIGANSRSEGLKVYQIHRDKPAILELDIPTSEGFGSYNCQLQDATGRVVDRQRVSAADAKRTVHLIVPAGHLQAGNYTVRVLGEQPGGQASPAEIERITFSVEFVL